MRSFAVASLLVLGCGNDIGHGNVSNVPPDAPDLTGPPGSPLVSVTSPAGGEAFYPSQTVAIAWTATDEDSPSVTCDVAAVGSANRVTIASAMALASGQAASATWTPDTAPASTYTIQVTCTDANALTGGDASGVFTVLPAPQQVSYAQVQAVFTASCTGNGCHSGVNPQGGLDLTPTKSYAALVGQPSGQCTPTRTLVQPGAPDQSYLVNKLLGTDLCFGSKMPKTGSIGAENIQLIRDWIFNGAPST